MGVWRASSGTCLTLRVGLAAVPPRSCRANGAATPACHHKAHTMAYLLQHPLQHEPCSDGSSGSCQSGHTPMDLTLACQSTPGYPGAASLHHRLTFLYHRRHQVLDYVIASCSTIRQGLTYYLPVALPPILHTASILAAVLAVLLLAVRHSGGVQIALPLLQQ